MPASRLRPFILLLIMACACAAQSREAVKHLGVSVDPYYRAAADASGRPMVAVGRAFDERLSQNDPKVIKEVEAEIRAQPDLITPMTLMVLSIRLYDAGYRDEAVFWHYVAKDRMRTLAQVVSSGVAGAVTATRDFAATAGPVINGYAFCDIEKQRATRRAAFEWVRDNPYQAIFMTQLASPFADRAAALRDVMSAIESDVRKEAEYISLPANLERLKKARLENGTDRLYCW